MALNASQVAMKQNETPTDWSQFDAQLSERSNWDTNRFSMDSKLHVRFYMKPRLNPDKSTEANRPIYEDTVYVEIMTPGEKNSIIQRPAWSQDYARFPKQFEQFKQGMDQVVGTPLKLLPFLSEAQVEELAFFKIRTVEQLAELNDSVLQNFMGARELQQKAQKYLASATSNETLAQENRELKESLAALSARVEALSKPQAAQVPPKPVVKG